MQSYNCLTMIWRHREVFLFHPLVLTLRTKLLITVSILGRNNIHFICKKKMNVKIRHHLAKINEKTQTTLQTPFCFQKQSWTLTTENNFNIKAVLRWFLIFFSWIEKNTVSVKQQKVIPCLSQSWCVNPPCGSLLNVAMKLLLAHHHVFPWESWV